MALKYQGMGWRSCSARIVPHVGHSPSSPRSSSSTSASHSSHQAIRTGSSLPPDPHPQLHRGGAEVEALPDTTFYVAEVRLRQTAIREECERRRVDSALDDVADLGPGRGLAVLQLLHGAGEGPG